MRDWLEDEPSILRKLSNGSWALYHNRLPRDFRLMSATHWAWKTAMASSAPAVAAFYGSIALTTAVFAAVGIFAGHSVVSILDRLSKNRSSNSAANQPDLLIRFGDLLNALRANATAAPNKDDAIRACLGILEIFARQITKSGKGEVSVSLALYVGNSRTKMKIRHRNPGNERPTNREFDCRRLLGHYACEAGGYRTIDDLKRFGREGCSSPTQSSVNYRSIFFIPFKSKKQNDDRVKGFVSIDCEKPFAFYGNRADSIVVTCEPIISHLNDLI